MLERKHEVSNVVSFEDGTYEARQGNRLPYEIAKASLGPDESWEYYNDNSDYDVASTPESYSLALLQPNYYFLMKPKGDFTLENNVMYFEVDTDKGVIKYTLKTPTGKKVEHTVMGINLGPITPELNVLDLLEERRQAILKYVTVQGHNVLPPHKMKPNKIYISRNDEGTLDCTIRKTAQPANASKAWHQQDEKKEVATAVSVTTEIEAPDFLASIDQLNESKKDILRALQKNGYTRLFDKFDIHQGIPCTKSTLVTDPVRPTDVRIAEHEIGCIRDTDGKIRCIKPGIHRFSPGQFLGKANVNDEHIVFGNYLHIIRVKPRSAKYAESNNKRPKLLTEGLHIIESPTLKVRDVIDLYGLEVRIKKTAEEMALEKSLKPGAPDAAAKKEYDADGNEKSTKSNEKAIKEHIQLFQWIPSGNFITAYDAQSKQRVIKGPAVIAIPPGWFVLKRASCKEETKKFTITAKTMSKDGIAISITGKGIVNYIIANPEEANARFGPNKIEEEIANKSRKELELYVNDHTYDELMTKSTAAARNKAPSLAAEEKAPPSYEICMEESVKTMQKSLGFREGENACVRFLSLDLESFKPTSAKVATVLDDTDAELLAWNRKLEVQQAELTYFQREPQLEALRQEGQVHRKEREKESRAADLTLAKHAKAVTAGCDNDPNVVRVFFGLREGHSPTFFAGNAQNQAPAASAPLMQPPVAAASSSSNAPSLRGVNGGQ